MRRDDLNVGDRVRIASWAEMLAETKEFGGREEDGDSIWIAQDNCWFVDGMSYLIGEEFIVEGIVPVPAHDITRLVLGGDTEVTGWTITPGMVQPADAEESHNIAVEDLLSIIMPKGE